MDLANLEKLNYHSEAFKIKLTPWLLLLRTNSGSMSDTQAHMKSRGTFTLRIVQEVGSTLVYCIMQGMSRVFVILQKLRD